MSRFPYDPIAALICGCEDNNDFYGFPCRHSGIADPTCEDHARPHNPSHAHMINPEQLQRVKRLIEAGATPEQAASIAGLNVNQLVQMGIIEPTEQEYIIPVSYAVSGYIKVKATSSEDAMSKAASHMDKLPTMEKPVYINDSYSIDGDPNEVELLTKLFAEGKLKAEPVPVDLDD